MKKIDDKTPSLSMPAGAMQELAQRATDLIVARIEGLRDEIPWRGAPRTTLEPLLREPPPEAGQPALAVLERAVRDVLPIAARVDHPRFFAFVPSAPTWPGVVADYLAAGFNVFQGTWLGSGGPSQLELVVIDWFRQWIGYPDSAGGLFTSGGSAAILDALVAAREHHGAPAQPAVFMSDQSHSALERAARIIGVRPDGIVKIASDDEFRIPVPELNRALAEARALGFTPIAVCANAGTTNTGAIDPLTELAELCARERIWLHVDAAYGGFAMLCERGKALLNGMDLADSISLDAHKWLFQPFEAGCVMVRDVAKLEQAFSVQPEYLQDTRLGMQQVNFSDRGLQLTRSFRALKVWMSVQTFGVAAFREAIAQGMELADRAGDYVRKSSSLELLSPPSLGIVCFRVRSPDPQLPAARLDQINEQVQAGVIASGVAMLSSTRLRGVYSLRLCIMSHQTTWDDVRTTLQAIEEQGRILI
ncbi:MAG: aminotransferase class I/II-fold pyridoxal phosphate-dependent enzyme [Gammaproteobacteria bacterium]|nr:aminotransferase class I/II-fold pyridoxal phosphate-dependent enzyme [Gammaproteobacteria bacterium]